MFNFIKRKRKWIPDREREINYDANTQMNGKYPEIKKLGACSPYGEMTPFVFHGRLMRMEQVKRAQAKGRDPLDYGNHTIIRDVATGEIISRLAHGCYFTSGYLEGDTMYVLGTRSRDPELGGCGDTVMIFQSRDLVQWEERELLSRKGWNYYNTSLAKGENGYVLCLEVGYAPDAPVGKTFTCFFATSPDMKTWTFMDNKTAYPMDRYCGGPYMRFHNGYFYLFLVTCLPCARFTNYLCRTKDFDKWEVSPYNPILMPSEEDKMISPRAAELEGLEETIRTCFNINNSDIDFCEWQGKTYINYAVGNQLGYYHMCEAEYDGPVGEFLEAFFQ